MAQIPFSIRSLALVTDRGISVPARRPFVTAQFVAPLGQRVPYPAFLDTGSPYSVIPFRLASQVSWSDLGGYLISGAQKNAAEWSGIPCRMAELSVELVDTQARIRTRTLRVVAKLLTQPAPAPLEQAVLLGMNFLTDNRLRQELDATVPALSGALWVT